MTNLIRVIHNRDLSSPEVDPHMLEEWLVTNGLGGYASGRFDGLYPVKLDFNLRWVGKPEFRAVW